MLRLVFAVVLFGAEVVVAAAQGPTYEIKLKSDVDVGKTIAKEYKSEATGPERITGLDGKLVYETPDTVEHEVYRLTELNRAAKNWKTAIVYTTAIKGEAGKAKPLPYQGRTLIVERKDGVTKYGAVGRPPLGVDDFRERLTQANEKDKLRNADEDRLYLPGKPVAIGEEWVLEAKTLAKQMREFVIDEASSKCTGKLVKVYSKGASQFGVIELHLKFGTKVLYGTMSFKEPLVFDTKLVIDTAIDGTSTERHEVFTGTLRGRGEGARGTEQFNVMIDRSTVGHMTRSAEIDDPKAVIDPAVTMIGPADWMPYVSKDGKYSVEFPIKPTVSSKTDEEGNTTVTASATLEKGHIYYAAAFTDYAKPRPGTEAKAVLDGIAKSFEKGTTESKSIELDGQTGVHLVRKTEESNEKVTMHYRAFFVDGRLYQVMVVVADGARDRADPKKFLDSFHFAAKEKK